MTGNIKGFLAVLTLIGLVLMAGSMSYDDEAMEEQAYSEGVCDGTHPAYKYKVKCSKYDGRGGDK